VNGYQNDANDPAVMRPYSAVHRDKSLGTTSRTDAAAPRIYQCISILSYGIRAHLSELGIGSAGAAMGR